jgi:biopolymer transport protein ExbD
MRFERTARARRRPGLTPLIDVVFLLLVFFMLATRFEREALLPLSIRAASASESGAAPRSSSSSEAGAPDALVVEIDAQGDARVAGQALSPEALRAALAVSASANRPVRVRPEPEAKLQAIVDVLAAIAESGAGDVALEGR